MRRGILGLALVLAATGADAKCNLKAPSIATAGDFFRVTWSFDGGGRAAIVDRDGVEAAAELRAVGSATLFATNVLGPHTFTLRSTGGRTCTATVTFTFSPPKIEGYDIVIVAGQSNAAGRGRGPFNDPLRNTTFDKRILQVGRIGASNDRIVPIGYYRRSVVSDGLHFWNKPESDAEISFALTFARWYVRRALAPNRRLIIIPAAHGGTPIRFWRDIQEGLPLYADMMERVRKVQSSPGQHRVVAFLWHQGETDILSAIEGSHGMTPAIYEQELTEFFRRVRVDLRTPGLPIVAGTFVPAWLKSDPAGFRIKADFIRAIARAASAVGNADVVTAQGLKSNKEIGEDGGIIHFNAASQVVLGNRYFGAWFHLSNGQAADPQASFSRTDLEDLQRY